MKRAFVILLATTVAASAQVQYAFTNLVGLPGGPGSVDGTAGAARFNYPSGVAVDSAGNVYVPDTYTHPIRKISPAAVVTTLAGTSGYGSANGIGSAARFNQPWAVAVDSADNVYVSDFNNYTIRKITANGVVTTLAGSAGQHGSADGTGSEVRFGTALPVPAGGLVPLGPGGVAVDGAG